MEYYPFAFSQPPLKCFEPPNITVSHNMCVCLSLIYLSLQSSQLNRHTLNSSECMYILAIIEMNSRASLYDCRVALLNEFERLLYICAN